MAGVGLRLGVIGAMLVLGAGMAFGAHAVSPPGGTFSGSYKVTINVTNTKPKSSSHWIYNAHPTCPSVCHTVSFRQRLSSEKSWRSTVLKFRWNGKAYALSKFLPRSADCVGKSKRTVKKGYDVTSSLKFLTRAVTKGGRDLRVTRWAGTGRDDYVPNAAGRAHHCSPGTYLYTLTGAAQ